MIVVRDVFQLKFGQAKAAINMWKEGVKLNEKLGLDGDRTRLLTDFAGNPYYTLILELSFDSLSEFETKMQQVMGDNEWKTWYQKFVPLVESGRREILKTVSSN